MSVIRVGSNGTYAEGWDQIFGGTSAKRAGGKGPKKASKKAGKKAGTKGANKAGKPKKPAGRKKASKRR